MQSTPEQRAELERTRPPATGIYSQHFCQSYLIDLSVVRVRILGWYEKLVAQTGRNTSCFLRRLENAVVLVREERRYSSGVFYPFLTGEIGCLQIVEFLPIS
jgi:hypothetical protein